MFEETLDLEQMFTGENLDTEFEGIEEQYDVEEVAEAAAVMAEAEMSAETLATFESIKLEKEVELAEKIAKFEEIELSSEARDALADMVVALGGVYGITGEGFKDSVVNIFKTIEIYARKFIAFVGKWVAKAGTLFSAFESKRKELLKAVKEAKDSHTIEVTQSWLNKIVSFFGGKEHGKDSQALAILTFNSGLTKDFGVSLGLSKEEIKDKSGTITQMAINPGQNNVNSKDVPNVTALLKKGNKINNYITKKAQDGARAVVQTYRTVRDRVYVLVAIFKEDGNKVTVVGSKLFKDRLNTSVYRAFNFNNAGEYKLSDLNIELKAVEKVLEMDKSSRRKLIDDIYKDIKDVLDVSKIKAVMEMGGDKVQDSSAEEKVGLKQLAIANSKAQFGLMMAVNKTFKDAIIIGKMIKEGKADTSSGNNSGK